MKLLLTSIAALFVGTLTSYSQDKKVVFNEVKPINIRLKTPFNKAQDTVLIYSSRAFNFIAPYKQINEGELEINLLGVGYDHIGDYRINVVSKNMMNINRESYNLRISTPVPVIRSSERIGEQTISYNPTRILWRNLTEEEFELKISGTNFYFKPDQIPITFEKGTNVIVKSFTIAEDSSIIAIINVDDSKAGLIKYKVVNFDGQECNGELFIEALGKTNFDISAIELENGKQSDPILINCSEPFQISKIGFLDFKTGKLVPDIYVEIDQKKLRPAVKQLPIIISPSVANYSANNYRIFFKTYDGDSIVLPTNPLQILDKNPVFKTIEKYPFESWSDEEIPVLTESRIFNHNDQFWLKCGKDSISCIYLKKNNGSTSSHFIKAAENYSFKNTSSGTYSVTHNGITLKGQINISKWPEINSIIWEQKNTASDRYFNGTIYAVKEEQQYRVHITLRKDMDLDLSKWKFFDSRPLKEGRENGTGYFYDIVIPSTIIAGELPKIEYQLKDGSFHLIQVDNLKEIQSFSTPVFENDFIVITPLDVKSDLNGIHFNALDKDVSNPFLLEKQTNKLNVKIDNKASYNKGDQTIIIKIEYGGKRYTLLDTTNIKAGSSLNFDKPLVVPIKPWDTVAVEVEFIGARYSPIIRTITKHRKKVVFYKKTQMNFGVGLPISATIVRDMRSKDWIYSPIAFQGSFTWNRYNKKTTEWRNLSYGASFGVSSLDDLVNDNLKYFGAIVCGHIELDPLYNANLKNIRLPVHLGLGVLSYWKSGVSYVNPVVQFSIVFSASR